MIKLWVETVGGDGDIEDRVDPVPIRQEEKVTDADSLKIIQKVDKPIEILSNGQIAETVTKLSFN